MYDSKNCPDKNSKRCVSHVLEDRGYFNSCSNSIINGCNGYYGNVSFNDCFLPKIE